MELAIKSSLTQPLCNTMNDKSMLAAIKSKMAVFECSGAWPHSSARSLIYSQRSVLFPLQGHCTKIRSRLSDAIRWILCAFCAAIIASTMCLKKHSRCF